MQILKHSGGRPDGVSSRKVRTLPRFLAACLALAAGLVLLRIVQFGPSAVRLGLLVACVLPIVPALRSGDRLRSIWLPVSLSVLVLLAAADMVQFGLASPAVLGLAAVIILAVAVVDARVTWALMAVTSLLLLGTGALFAGGWLRPVAELDALNAGFWNWVLLVLVLNTALAAGLRVFQRGGADHDPAATPHDRDVMTAMFRSSTEGVILCDTGGRIRAVNPSITRHLGWTAEDLVGRRIAAVIDRKDRPAMLEAIGADDPERLSAAPLWSGDLGFRHRDGACVLTRTSVTAVHDGAGNPRSHVILVRDLSERQHAADELRDRSEHDILTDLCNRPGLARRIAEALEAPPDAGEEVAPGLLFLIDIDAFMQVNDRYGLDAGDALLWQFARRLEACAGDGDIVARHAGDEFALFRHGPDAPVRAGDLERRLRAEIARPFWLDGGRVRVTASVGIARFPEDATDAAGLLAAADQALFEAKSRGGGRTIIHTAEIGRRARDRGQLVHDLQEGLARGEFRLLYQPVVELGTGRVTKAEALVRWQHPSLGAIGPDRFVPLAESAGRIDDLGDWALRQCCAELPRMRERFGAGFQASVNVSPLQLAGSGTAQLDSWRALIAGAASEAGGLILEITESALLDPGPATVARLNDLRAAGAKIALDDFGAGHTSLLYYLTHDFDYLKIDRDFIRNLPESARALALCESILGFADRLGAVAIAEGIETMAQVEMLRGAGCALGQGYLFSPPLPLEGLLDLPLSLPVAARNRHAD